jgi:hypothetical protein
MAPIITRSAVAAPPRLGRANEIRIDRARLKERLKAGTLGLAGALHEQAVASMLTWDLLLCVPGVDEDTAHRMIDEIAASCFVTVGHLTMRQRELLGAKAPSVPVVAHVETPTAMSTSSAMRTPTSISTSLAVACEVCGRRLCIGGRKRTGICQRCLAAGRRVLPRVDGRASRGRIDLERDRTCRGHHRAHRPVTSQ